MMSDETELDRAHARMRAGGDAERLQFYAALADTELYLLLEDQAEGDQITPRLFEVDGAQMVAGFDRLDRLSEFAGAVSAYAALPGRVAAQVLAEQGLSLGVNPQVAPSDTVIGPEALRWLLETLEAPAPDQHEARIAEILPPGAVPDALLEALGARLDKSVGMAQEALLVHVSFDGGGSGHILALVGAQPHAEEALTRAVAEALAFSGVDAGFLDVAFFAPEAPVVARLRRSARRFAIPQPQVGEVLAPSAPGTDPDRPPRLR